MSYLLDTDTCIGMIRATARKALAKGASIDAGEIHVCTVVQFELLTGAERSDRPTQEKAKVDSFCARFPMLSFDANAALEASRIRNYLERRGIKIGPYDTLIAAIARSRDLTVVTQNVGEFSRVPNLRVENWEA